MKFLKTLGYLLGLPIILIAWWWIATSGEPNFFVPTPVQLFETFIETWIGDRILTDVLPSVMRLVIGLGIAIVLGIVLGLAVGLNRTVRAVTEPVFEFFRALPPPVLVPVLMLLVGINDGMKIAVIIFGCVWPVLLNTIEGVRSIDSVQTETSKSYGLSGFNRIRYQVLPSSTPTIMAGIRQSLSIGLILMVISEMFASSSGLGFTIVQFQRSFAVPEMWSGIVVLGLIGVALSFIFQWCERRVLRWYHGLKEVENAV
ncbi:ABC transporter permease [Paeniglutamicibacter cryotolerans]|uniref:ABC-type nitrate/sulfonate/bicarbonate transport system permease component n=1 Tax=Paeniglutamicibacter cryotolerans TaxID=670079 RepID=A0A839QIC4_9MICC|nr:ABC transporter permease [Paeniglutamicibacter cryotolerans]MBB2994494.1 ABC-type nitrate/sulfonate/bicarbonate transport system permease component [Paeniglutamicibacter cryotolerans]